LYPARPSTRQQRLSGFALPRRKFACQPRPAVGGSGGEYGLPVWRGSPAVPSGLLEDRRRQCDQVAPNLAEVVVQRRFILRRGRLQLDFLGIYQPEQPSRRQSAARGKITYGICKGMADSLRARRVEGGI
jgi:hypothetical protein